MYVRNTYDWDMLVVKEKHSLYRFERRWFESKKGGNCDVVKFMRVDKSTLDRIQIEDLQHTLITDLNMSEEMLLQCCRKNYRYEIRKAKKEKIEIIFYTKQLLTDSILQDLKQVYYNFCDACGNQELKDIYDEEQLKDINSANGLVVTKAVYEKGNVYHVYVCDEQNVMLMYSASDFRNPEVDRNLAGRANKLLHYEDMLYFKKIGKVSYDWGNISSVEKPNGIDTFKMGFGGENKEIYNIMIPQTIWGKLLVTIYHLVHYFKMKKGERILDKSSREE